MREDYDHDVGVTRMPCNWLQIAENNMDPYHVEYLHFMYTNYVHEKLGKPKVEVKRHKQVAFEVFEYGIIKKRLWEGDSEDSDEWRTGHPQIWPGTAIVTYPNGGVQAQIRVPVDDTNTMVYWYNAKPRPKGQAPKPDCRVWDNPLRDSRGEYLTDNLNGQDLMVMFTQGEIPTARWRTSASRTAAWCSTARSCSSSSTRSSAARSRSGWCATPPRTIRGSSCRWRSTSATRSPA